MHRISTNLTLFYKFFLPVFWIVFFGALTVAALFYPFDYIGDMPAGNFRIGIVFFYLTGLLLLAFTLLRLKRVEADENFFYITNYFKTARYPFHNIERVVESKFFFFRTATIHFKEPGVFGSRIFFVPSNYRFREFWEAHLELKERLLVEV
ncbi:MAG: hypothetical protein H6557_10845 [Lewinellaceae bacterium]|nr:hypothetical protein [Phaeodactylibacter sp.]MCB9037106.1 hypothetical protein [Lewinellaceae bacterium]